MISTNKLAIIIPAFKVAHLKDTLLSLKSQSNQHFNVYIGDDFSPEDIFSIVSSFEEDGYFYRRFSENFGRNSLISHWNRCLSLLKNEEWFMLLGDDDILDPDCVSLFYHQINQKNQFDVIGFSMKIINNQGQIIESHQPPRDEVSNLDFLTLRLNLSMSSSLSQYIFNTRRFRECGGFVEFPLAWASDDATIISCASKKGIRYIRNCNVYWRYGGESISSNQNDEGIVHQKLVAAILFLKWVRNYVSDERRSSEFEGLTYKWFSNQLFLLKSNFQWMYLRFFRGKDMRVLLFVRYLFLWRWKMELWRFLVGFKRKILGK